MPVITNLNADTITVRQIEALREEALDAGDDAMVTHCTHALLAHDPVGFEGSPAEKYNASIDESRQACADAINAARAMGDK